MKSLLKPFRLEFLGYLLFASLSLFIAAVFVSNTGLKPGKGLVRIGRSVPDIVFEDQNGVYRLFRELRGTPVVLVPIFTSCRGNCPELVERLTRSLGARAGKKPFRVLLFTFDSKDTVRTLRRFAKAHRVPASWILARAQESQTQVLMHALGIKTSARNGGGFVHPGVVVFLSDRLETTGYLSGNPPPGALVTALREAGKKPRKVRLLSVPYLLAFSVLGAFLTSLTLIQGANAPRPKDPEPASSRKSDSDRRRQMP